MLGADSKLIAFSPLDCLHTDCSERCYNSQTVYEYFDYGLECQSNKLFINLAIWYLFKTTNMNQCICYI